MRPPQLSCHPATKLADARPAPPAPGFCNCGRTDRRSHEAPPAGPVAGELLYQEGAVAAGEAPPFVLAKGPELPFTAGAPLAACGPSIDDYQLFPGVSPFLYGSFSCQGSIRCVGQQAWGWESKARATGLPPDVCLGKGRRGGRGAEAPSK